MLLTSHTALAALLAATVASAGRVQIPLGSDQHPDVETLNTVLNDKPLTLSRAEYKQLEAHIASLEEARKIRISESGPALEITEGQKAVLTYHGIHFMDVTDEEPIFGIQVKSNNFANKQIAVGAKALAPLLEQLSVTRMQSTLESFSGFRSRYYRSQTGGESQKWLLGQIKEAIKQAPHMNINVKEFSHSWGPQSSIIVHIPSQQSLQPGFKSKDEKLVIVGAHLDSTNMLPFLGAPGADDDGSGTTSTLEAFRVLTADGVSPRDVSIEFHWYSAEEGGMLGSQAVANSYAKAGKNVVSMLQMDMTAFVKPGFREEIGVITDYVDPDFTTYVKRLIDEYCDIPWVETKCGYACSDHASWTKVHVPSAFAIESKFENSNHDIHSTRDTIHVEGFSFEHMKQFAKLVVGYVREASKGE